MLKVKPFLFILFLTVFVALFTTACSDTGSNSSGGIYDNSTTNPGGGTENPGGGDTENPGGGDTENPGGGDTENPGGGEEDKPGVTAIDLAGNPFSLLGVYDVTLYGIDGEPVTTPAAKSELRVGLNLSTAAGGMTAPEVIMYLDFEGKKINFDERIIDLSGLESAGGDLNKFIADTFANLGAELIENSKYGLYFTLDPNKNPNYSPVIDNLIIKNGQYLKLKLDKAKDLEVDSGLGLEGETPTDPEEPEVPEEPVVVPVESVAIKGQQTVVHGGASFKLTVEVLPNDATNKIVTWSSSHPDYIAVDTQGNVTIKGYTEETITITATSTADKTKTAVWHVNIEKAAITGISVTPADMTLTLKNDGSEVSANITTAIEPAIATDYTTVNYAVTSGAEYVKVDTNGVVTAVAQGEAVVTVTVGSLTKTVNVTVNPAPLEEIPVTNITVTTSADKVYKKGTNVTINFTLTPTTTTDTMVKYTTQSSSGNLPTANGTGSFELTNVQGGETVTFTTAKGQQATYTINAVDGIAAISFVNETITVEQTKTGSNELNNKDAIQNSSSSITYESLNPDLASVDSSTGVVTGLKNGLATIRVSVQPKYESAPVTKEFKVDVLGHIDYADETSLQGTYDIVFFGTNSNGSGLTAAVLRTNCDIYKNLWNVNSCPNKGTFNGNYEIPYPSDFAGRAIIKVSNGALKVHTKVAMLFTNMGSMAADAAKDDRYQYTVYEDASLNTWLDTNHIGYMPGRNLSATTNPKNPKYYFEQDKKSYTGYTNLDIVLFSHFEGKSTPLGEVNPDTRLILRKISSQVITMDPNSLTEEPFNKINLSLGNVDFTAPME